MPKIYAACGAAGFALSFIVSLFSGAPFHLVLVRALIFCAVFAGLAALFGFLLNRFVPDLFDKEAAAAPAPKPIAKERGGKLDITISDGGEASSEEDEGLVPDFMKDRSRGGGAPSASEESVASGDSQGEPAPARAERSAKEPARAESPAKASAADAPAPASASDEEDADMLDDASFDDKDEEESDAPLPSPQPSAGEKSKDFSPKDLSTGIDAATMAKAIRTVLAAKGE